MGALWLRLAEVEAARAVALGVSDYSVVRIMGRVALGLYGDSAELDQPLVCSDVLGVYEKFLQQYPDSGWDRGSYVKWLSRCGRTSDAKRQLNLIPSDRLRVGAFGGQAAYDKLVKRLAS